jgi:hypothetical protein
MAKEVSIGKLNALMDQEHQSCKLVCSSWGYKHHDDKNKNVFNYGYLLFCSITRCYTSEESNIHASLCESLKTHMHIFGHNCIHHWLTGMVAYLNFYEHHNSVKLRNDRDEIDFLRQINNLLLEISDVNFLIIVRHGDSKRTKSRNIVISISSVTYMT